MNRFSPEIPWDQQLARILIKPFRNTGLHPNHLTTLTLILGQCASWLFAFGMSGWAWLAALLYMLAVFSDHLDGELARMTGKTSEFGHRYDYIVGGINYMTLFIGIGIGLSGVIDRAWPLYLGLVAGLCNPFVLYLRMRMEDSYGKDAVEHPGFAGFEIEDFIYLIGPLIWCFGVPAFFIPYALGNIGYLVWTLLEFRRWGKSTA